MVLLVDYLLQEADIYKAFFGGIRMNLTPPAMNSSPQITVTINQHLIGILGWVSTQAMQRQVLRGNVLPGSTQAVPGSVPTTNFQRNNGGGRQGGFIHNLSVSLEK